MTAARVMTVMPEVGMILESEFGVETLLYAINEPPHAELTVLTASRTSVELSVGEVGREDV